MGCGQGAGDYREGPEAQRKSTVAGKQVLAFRVATGASKHAIRSAVETIFKVKVAEVRIINYHGKEVRRGRTLRTQTRLEEGIRHTPGGRANDRLRRFDLSHVARRGEDTMGIKKLTPTSPGASLSDLSDKR